MYMHMHTIDNKLLQTLLPTLRWKSAPPTIPLASILVVFYTDNIIPITVEHVRSCHSRNNKGNVNNVMLTNLMILAMILHLPPTIYHMPHVTYHILPTKFSPSNTTCYMLSSSSLTATNMQNWTSWWIRSAKAYLGEYNPVGIAVTWFFRGLKESQCKISLVDTMECNWGTAWEYAWEGTSDHTSR
jgi:hypothetical protein